MHNPRRSFLALAAVMAAVTVGTYGLGVTGPTAATTAAAPPQPVELIEATLEWGDDLNHFVVTKVGADALLDTTPAFADVGVGTTSAQSSDLVRASLTSGDDGSVRIKAVTFGDGTTREVAVGWPITLIIADTDDARAYEAALPDGYYLGQDPTGELWGWAPDGRLYDHEPAPPLPGTHEGSSAPSDDVTDSTDGRAGTGGDTPIVGSVPVDDREFINMLDDSGLFEEIRPLGGGQAAVATDVGHDTVAEFPPLAAVHEDLLLGFAATNDTDFPLQWTLDNTGAATQAGGWPGVPDADIDAPKAWGASTGAGVTVAIIDSGVAVDHPDLAANVWHNTNETCGDNTDNDENGYIDDCDGWNFGEGDSDPRPNSSDSGRNHGTHVAGIVAAETSNNRGIAGVAPDAQIMALKVSAANGAIAASSVLAASRYAVDNGADIINMSLATTQPVPRAYVTPLESAIAYAHDNGVLVITGTGNNGVDTTGTTTIWPAGFSEFYDNVISAGASTNSDARASFSNYGAALSVYAPGWFIHSTLSDNHSYGPMSGTSMAAPTVAGAAAVVLASGRATSPAAIRDLLISTAETTPAGKRLNVRAALGIAETTPGELSMTVEGLNALAENSPSTITATLAGSDTPAGARARFSVATIDDGAVFAVGGLEVTVPGGAVHTTGIDGVLDAIAVDHNQMISAGQALPMEFELPAGRYALVAELLDSGGSPITDGVAVFFDVGAEAASPPIPLPPTTEVPATTTPAGGATTTIPSAGPGATTTTTPGDGATTTLPGGGPGATTTTAPSGWPGSPTTTIPSAGPGATTTSAPGSWPGSTTTTTPRATSTTTPGLPTTTTPRTTSTTAAGVPTTTNPGSPTTTTPGGSPPPTTTPAPEPDADGRWRLNGVTPRVSSLAGGTPITISGVFPTGTDLYVWFGSTVVTAESYNGTTINTVTPPRVTEGVVDLAVRFSHQGDSIDMILVQAITYSVNGGSTGGGDGGGQGSTTTTTPGAVTTTTSGGTRNPTTTAPGAESGSPTTTAPDAGPGVTTTTAPGGGGAPSPTTAPPRTRGNLTLRAPAPGSAIGGLSAASFGAVCTTRSCAGQQI